MRSTELAAALADALANAGGDMVFGMPGGGNNLDVVGAAEACGLRFVLAHAETSAAIMAAVYGDLTGLPTMCVVTRGPGAASAVNGVANALLDRQPLVVVTDVVSAADRTRIAHQRLDQRAMFAPVAKWSATLGEGDTRAAVEYAVAAAMSHPRGPVHLDFDPSAPSTAVPQSPAPVCSEKTDVAQAIALIAAARQPVIILGVGARDMTEPVRSLLAGSSIPVLMTYRAKGLIPDAWANAAGLLSGATTEAPLLEAADLLLMIGVDSVEFIPNTWPYAAPVVSLASWSDDSPYLEPGVELVGGKHSALAGGWVCGFCCGGAADLGSLSLRAWSSGTLGR